MSTDVKTMGALTFAGMMASSPFGLPMNQIALGTLFAIIGVVGRAAFEMQRANEGNPGLQLSKVAGWVGAGFTGAPFLTIVYLILLRMMNVQSDGIVSLGLLFLGFSGPRLMQWLLNTGILQLNKRTGLNIPDVLSREQPPKPGA